MLEIAIGRFLTVFLSCRGHAELSFEGISLSCVGNSSFSVFLKCFGVRLRRCIGSWRRRVIVEGRRFSCRKAGLQLFSFPFYAISCLRRSIGTLLWKMEEETVEVARRRTRR